MRLEGKVCLITGAASGIGKATTLLFMQEGATVIAGDISKENLDSLVKEAEGLPGKVDPYILNVTDRDQIKEVVEKSFKSTAGLMFW